MLIKVNSPPAVLVNQLLLCSMTKRRVKISIVSMLLAILAVTGFQCYWLVKSYKEEDQNLRLRTNILFRETVYHLQSEKLRLDSTVQIRYVASPVRAGVWRTLQDRYRDSTLPAVPRGVLTMEMPPRNDTAHQRKPLRAFSTISLSSRTDSGGVHFKEMMVKYDDSLAFRKSRNKFYVDDNGFEKTDIFRMLRKVDSLQDSIKVTELSKRYSDLLGKEKIEIPFVINKSTVVEEKIMAGIPDPPTSNEVVLGFNTPYTLRLELQNTTAYLLKKLLPQITVSFVLVGLTIFSFILLLRNLMQQRKLTQLKNDLISNITHELKTPIATVSVAIEALKSFNALHDPARTKEYLDISSNELQRLSMLVDKVLKLSMFEKHQVELREEPFNLQQLVEEVVASMRLQFEKYHAEVSVQVQGDHFEIMADRLHITSVIFNLLDNALKYSKEDPAIRIELKELTDTIELCVADNGIGISPEYQTKIFEKFFRVPAGNTHNVKGYGLGLSYVAYVVQRHDGKIQVESQPGVGSRFTIKLSSAS